MSKKEWKTMEENCFKYLEEQYKNKYCKIVKFGDSDSTKPDILIETKFHNKFYVEIKSKSSQCCQFVLFPNIEEKKFEISVKNKTKLLKNQEKIIKHMNANFKKYCDVDTTGIPVNIDINVLYDLVNEYYKEKNVKYFITAKSYKSNKIIFPLEAFENYFDIAAIYRIKKSGSGQPAQKIKKELADAIKAKSCSGSIEYIKIGNKTRCFVHTNDNIHKKSVFLGKQAFEIKYSEHCENITRKKDHVFEIRRLSNTSNPTVICKLTLKKEITEQNKKDLSIFEAELNN